ncbi:MAG TPA: peptidoglycan-binding protein [Nocardioidaceae bacterium]|nr:peptidoglycan-binding protein [Nocardioidaceae bacterium]
MQRGTKITTSLVAAATVAALGTGAAFGVLGFSGLVGAEERRPAPVEKSPVAAPLEEPPVESEPEPDPEPEALIERGDRGVKVRALQHRLSQIAWYTPPMSGAFDGETFKAVRGFQRKRGFEVTGEVNARTWKRLVRMTRKPTGDEMFNRYGPALFSTGDSGPRVREIQARLRQIAWFFGDVSDNYGDQTAAAVKGFQAKRMIPVTGEVDQRTLDLLEGMTTEPTADELANRPPDPADGAALDPRCTTGRVLCIDKSSNSLRWVVDGDVLVTLDVRFGREGMETREGQFAVNYKSRDHVSSIYDTSMPFAMFFSGGQAVHYSPDFAANGYNGASHGCVNVRDYGSIASLFDQVGIGDKVVVYWS